MSLEIRSSDRRRYMNELQAREKEIAAGLLKASQPSSPKALQENEKRMRREIANSNERRRMQCINAGFSNLRSLIPQLEGEKLSKAAILQHTTEYIASIEKEKTRLQAQLDHTRRLLSELGQDRVLTEPYLSTSPPPSKRKKRDTESSDEGVGMMSDASDESSSDLQQENAALRQQLEIQKQQCAVLEDRNAVLEDRNRLLEAELMSLLQAKATHSPSAPNKLQAVNLESHHLQQISLYSRELAVISSRESFVSSPVNSYQPPRPLSPTPERNMSVDGGVDGTSPGYFLVSSPHSTHTVEKPISFAMKADGALSDTNSKASNQTSSAIVTVLTSTDQRSYNPHHNYCHRDHPRRRHRQQAQLDQLRAEEDLRQREQIVALTYKPKHNTQNLENLVEAIRQIEGDRLLCDDQTMYNNKRSQDNGQPRSHSEESERETSSDQEEVKSESSGHDSPIHHHDFNQPQPQVDTSVVNQPHISPVSTTANSINRSSSSSDKYPIATNLLHSPIPDQQSYYRPGVIVHKQ